MQYRRFNELIRSVQNHVESTPGVVIRAVDDPFKRLLGFESSRTEERWMVSLTDLKSWLVAGTGRRLSVENTDLFRSVEGRAELARRLTAGEAPFPQAV